jgi:hypothetical protein
MPNAFVVFLLAFDIWSELRLSSTYTVIESIALNENTPTLCDLFIATPRFGIMRRNANRTNLPFGMAESIGTKDAKRRLLSLLK